MMNQVDVLRKFHRLNPREVSVTTVGFLLLTACLLCSVFFFDNGIGNRGITLRSSDGLKWWFGVEDYGNKSANLEEGGDEKCDYYDGKWVWDETYPLYDSKDCQFAEGAFRCLINGRPDDSYTKWRWQPNNCDMPRFNGKLMLEKLRNKRLAIIGDSIGRNQWESLLCMLSSSISNKSSIYEVNDNPITKHKGFLVFRFQEYNCTVEYYRAPFLVVQSRPPPGSPPHVKYSLKLDQFDWNSAKYKDADVLIFNAGHWWTNHKTIQSGCYFEEGHVLKMNMSVETAFKKSMETLVGWVESQVNTNKTSVFFRSYAPVHFRGGNWKSGGSCHLEMQPDLNAPHMPQHWGPYNMVKDVLSGHPKTTNFSKVTLLDVTYLTLQRKDGHTSIYHWGPNITSPLNRQDCSHWCLPGVPDTWNELLYTFI